MVGYGAGEQMRGDGGEDEEGKGWATAQVRQDGRWDDLPRGLREDVSRLDGGENGGQDGRMREAWTEVWKRE